MALLNWTRKPRFTRLSLIHIYMITQVYAHILDEDRKVNAQKFEDAFYASANPDLRTVRPPEPPKPCLLYTSLL